MVGDQTGGEMSQGPGKPLATLIADVPPVADRALAERHLMDLRVQCGEDVTRLAALLEQPKVADLLAAACGGSPYIAELAAGDLKRLERILSSPPDRRIADLSAGLDTSLAAAGDEAQAMHLLRRYKQDATLTIALADLAGAFDMPTCMRTLSIVAETALTAAVRFLLRKAAEGGKFNPPDPADPAKGSGFVVLGMGKLGARELNFSSDVDLIVLYDAEIAPLPDGLEPSTFFVRITKGIVKLLQERTSDGYVQRVDLRLRPDPGATAVAISLPAALQYYESMGQNWERAALIKARPVAGDVAAGEAFLSDIAPFIWRRYLDFAAIMDIHAMKRQIHAHKGHSNIAVAGHNIKVGRGGIREIEFFVQTQQLIAGGRQPDLRGRETLPMLRQLAQTGWINAKAATDLTHSYLVLRKLEHRLQMMRDEQTHTLPDDAAGLAHYARFAGFDDADQLAETLREQMRLVEGHYAALFEQAPELSGSTGSLVFTGGDDDPDTIATLSGLGFSAPAEVTACVRSWHFGRYPATRSEKARERLTELTPALLEALAKTDNPQAAFLAFDKFLGGLPAGVQLFSLLRANPELLAMVALIMGSAPRLAGILSRRVHVLDAMLEPEFHDSVPSQETLKAQLGLVLADGASYEETLDAARRFGQEQSFLIGARVLSGSVRASQAGAAYAALAELLVDRLHMAAREELARAHGKIPSGNSIVIAMGKLGGLEMTASSDLDLILIYDCPEEVTQSDGARALSPAQYYMRLTQRLIAAVSAPTAEGNLYDVDMRLRPTGSAGPVATSLQSFIAYHEDSAWTWEHLALTRARVISGDEALRAATEAEIVSVLCRQRDRAKLVADVIDIRQRIHQAKGSAEPWVIKTVPGGLVDIEFIAQFMQLAHAHNEPGVLDQNTRQALSKLGQHRLLDANHAETLIETCRLYHNLTQVLRLALAEDSPIADMPDGLRERLARAANLPDFSTLDAHLRQCQAQVRDIFVQVIGEGAWGAP